MGDLDVCTKYWRHCNRKEQCHGGKDTDVLKDPEAVLLGFVERSVYKIPQKTTNNSKDIELALEIGQLI